MGELGAIRRAEWARGWLAAVLLAVFAVLLTGCSAGSLLSDSGAPSGGNAKGKTVPPVAYQQITGIPPDKLSALKQSLASAGGQHDIGFVEGSVQSGVFSLGGSVRAIPGNAGVRVVYEWQFRDGEGVLIDTLSGEDNAGVYSGPDPWGAVTPDVLDRVARRTADMMAQKLAAMGYAARLSTLPRRRRNCSPRRVRMPGGASISKPCTGRAWPNLAPPSWPMPTRSWSMKRSSPGSPPSRRFPASS